MSPSYLDIACRTISTGWTAFPSEDPDAAPFLDYASGSESEGSGAGLPNGSAMSTTPPLPSPGWHPDPANASGERWWDGAGWTEHTRTGPAAAFPPPPGPLGTYQAPTYQPYSTPSQPFPGSYQSFPTAQRSFWHSNSRSFTAIIVAAVYIVIAISAHIVFLGIVPALAAVRAFQAREKLAPAAALAAVVTIVVAVVALGHH